MAKVSSANLVKSIIPAACAFSPSQQRHPSLPKNVSQIEVDTQAPFHRPRVMPDLGKQHDTFFFLSPHDTHITVSQTMKLLLLETPFSG